MANNTPDASCATCIPGGPTAKEAFTEGLWKENPIAVQILGICSALAVTNRLQNALVMGMALIFVAAMSNLLVSILRRATPRRIRMIAEVAIIATFVILFDQFLKAFYWDMSKQLGPYVGLIITNCIVMGRAEAFALQNPPGLSLIDGIGNGVGYALVLAIIGLFRELIGAGTVFGFTVFSTQWYVPNQVMILAPGAFIALGFLIAVYNRIKGQQPDEDNK